MVNELLARESQFTGIAKSNGKNALHISARSVYTYIVRVLLVKDPQIARRTDIKGQTTLRVATKGANYLDAVKELLQVDPKIVMLPDENGNTPLHLDTRKKHEEVLSLDTTY